MPYNCVKLKEQPLCPKCNDPIDLPRTREKEPERRRYYMQSKRIQGEENVGTWMELSEISSGEAHAPCKKCKNLIEFDIKFGTLINPRLRQ